MARVLVARLGAAGSPDSPGSPEPAEQGEQVAREARGLLVARGQQAELLLAAAPVRGSAAARVEAEQVPRVVWGSTPGQTAV